MQMVFFTGNLTATPAVRTVNGDKTVCSFTVAVNRTIRGEKQTTYWNVTTWEKRAETCAKYLTKGSKVAITGDDVHVHPYTSKDGKVGASLEITANSVEFFSSKNENYVPVAPNVQQPMTVVEDDSDLPF